jgi:PKHD-type hydroxylase
MLICIPQMLKRDEVDHILNVLRDGQFVDGKLSAGHMARDVKNNLEYQRPDNEPAEIDGIVGRALLASNTFQDFALPKQIAPPIYSKYVPGMDYGTHVDAPLMGQQSMLRSDLSMTLFLSDPTSYDGGELTVGTTFGDQEVKLAPGDAVLYPSTTLHRVQPVTRGERIVVLSWIQSFIKDEGMREIMFDLATASRQLQQPGADLGELGNRFYKVYANLMRRQAEV